MKTIEDKGKKQIDALESLKPKEETKPIQDRSNNKSKAKIMFDELINKRKELMSELYNSVDCNNLNYEYVGPTKDVSFYEYRDSKELFNAIKNSQIKFSEVKNKQNEFLNKLSNIKVGKKTPEQKGMINNLEKFYNSREQVINFFRDYIEMLSNANYDAKQNETKGTRLKILTPKHSHKKRKDSLETRFVLLISSLELEISGVATQSIHQNSKKWRLLLGTAQ